MYIYPCSEGGRTRLPPSSEEYKLHVATASPSFSAHIGMDRTPRAPSFSNVDLVVSGDGLEMRRGQERPLQRLRESPRTLHSLGLSIVGLHSLQSSLG
eukprot:scaffold49653_cov31-Tisochrysis_lutea.AAC.6